jgi:hypothetical protein
MVSQGVLPFQLEKQERGGLTALAGLMTYVELAHVAALWRSVEAEARTGRIQGYSDVEMVLSLVLLNLAGGESVDDVERLEADDGLRLMMMKLRWHGLPRRERRDLERRWRKKRVRTFPTPSAIRRWLSWFHNDSEERKREEGKAFIPERVEALVGLGRANAGLLAFLQRHRPVREATLDMDATLVESHKREALFCYRGFRAYQPLNVWWAEQRTVVCSEFRDGNVPAGYEQRRILEEALSQLPEGVDKVRMRSDTAGYQWELLKYCAEGRHERFGVIEFTVSADVTDAFRQAMNTTPDLRWQALGDDTNHEWAEVCFVPQDSARKKNGPTYRFLAIREPLRQLSLLEGDDAQLPFPVLSTEDEAGRPSRYKLFALVTNLKSDAADIIEWHRQRCGDSEQAHAVMKHDLAGGKLPSKLFGANAAWWAIMILTLNLDAVMRRLALGEAWVCRRLKAIRFHLIHTAGRLVEHARRLTLRISARSYDLLADARRAIARLAAVPDG